MPFTSDQARVVILTKYPPEASIVDLEEIETYLYGPDDSEEYFSKFDSDDELLADFASFIEGYERG